MGDQTSDSKSPSNYEQLTDNPLPILTVSNEGVLKHHVLSLREKDKPYFEEKDWKKHIKRTYEKKKKFQCHFCGEMFLHNASLIAHITGKSLSEALIFASTM